MADSVLKLFQLGLEGPYTSGSASVYNGGSAVAATRRLAILEAMGADWDFTFEAPAEARGTYAGSYQHILHQQMAKGKVPALVYCDDLLFYLRMLVSGSPTVVTLPNSPTVLLAATAIASTMPSLTTQPNAAADGALSKILAITLANPSPQTTAVNVTVAGTNSNGAVSEVLNFSAGTTTVSKVGGGTGATTVTLYTKNYFSTVTSITTSAQPASDTIAVAGVNAFLWTFTADMATSTLWSATGEYFDGTGCWTLPGLVLQKGSLTAEIGKSLKLDGEFSARKKDYLAPTAASINPSAPVGTHDALTNLADNPLPAIPTYITRFYADNIGVAPGTTQISARLTSWKADFDSKAELGKAADGTPFPNFVSRGYYGEALKVAFTLLFNNGQQGSVDPAEVVNFLGNQARTIRVAFPGAYLPCGVLSAIGNWPAALGDSNAKGGSYGFMVDTAGRYTKAAEKKVLNRTAYEFEQGSEVDLVSMNAPTVYTVVSRLNPNQ